MFLAQDHLRSIVDHDGAIILDIRKDQFYSVNPVGSFIWDRVIKGEDVDQIAKALAEVTGVDICVILADVNEFLADLKNKHLIGCS
jgi:hypothetical protein